MMTPFLEKPGTTDGLSSLASETANERLFFPLSIFRGNIHANEKWPLFKKGHSQVNLNRFGNSGYDSFDCRFNRYGMPFSVKTAEKG
jgi:hypothetical protein